MDDGSTVKLFDTDNNELGNYALQNTDTDSTPNFFERVLFNGATGIAAVKSIEVSLSRSGAIDNVATVPLPAAAWLLGSGLIGLASLIRRKQTARLPSRDNLTWSLLSPCFHEPVPGRRLTGINGASGPAPLYLGRRSSILDQSPSS